MADGTLPPLNPDTAGHCAFYNLISQAGLTQASLTWSDVVNNGSVTSYTVYDNGVILQYSDAAFGSITVRCKTDGWVVAYTGWDGTVATDSGARAAPSGDCLTVNGVNSSNTISDNRLVNAIEDIQSDLSDWNLANYSRSDIGIYDFVYGSDAISHFYEKRTGEGNSTRSVEQTSETDLHAIHLGAHVEGETSDYSDLVGKVAVNGETVLQGNNQGNPDHNHLDVWQAMETNGTTSVKLTTNYKDGYGSSIAAAAITAYWSQA